MLQGGLKMEARAIELIRGIRRRDSRLPRYQRSGVGRDTPTDTPNDREVGTRSSDHRERKVRNRGEGEERGNSE